MCAGSVPGGPLVRRNCTPARTWAARTKSKVTASRTADADDQPAPALPAMVVSRTTRVTVRRRCAIHESCFSARRSCTRLPSQDAIAPPDGNLDHTDGQHERRGDERSHRPSESWSSTGERWEHDDCCSSGDDRNDSTHGPDLGEPEVRRHTSRDRRLCGGTVRSDLPRRILILAHGGSIDLRALAASVGNRAPAARSHAGAPLSWTIERADTSFVCERVRKAAAHKRQPQRAERARNIARAAPELGG